jgi:hypothetical protein
MCVMMKEKQYTLNLLVEIVGKREISFAPTTTRNENDKVKF